MNEITLLKVVSPSPHHTVKRIECSLVHAFFMPFLFCQAMQCALYKYTFISIMLSAFIIEFFLKTEQTGTVAPLGYSQPSHYSRQVGIPILGMLTVFSKRNLFLFFFSSAAESFTRSVAAKLQREDNRRMWE